jgi:hypothetical protein
MSDREIGLPADFDPESCYRERDGSRQPTEYLTGLVLSGAFLPHEIVGSATLAGKRAEEKGSP